MRIILSTENSLTAMRLRDQIIKSIKGEIDGLSIDTWSYTRSGDNFDILYHDPAQYTQEPNKNVLFKLEIDGSNVLFSSVWWKKNPEPSYEIMCLHTGRLTEMLLRYFRGRYIKFTVVD
jgi:hypothetical protein